MKILLAEDDRSIQAIATMALIRIGGHDILAVSNGCEVLDRISSFKPDLILLDVMMPKLNGFETCAKLKANQETAQIPVLFLSARAQLHEIHHGMSLGALGYILKPFDPFQLNEQIQNLLAGVCQT